MTVNTLILTPAYGRVYPSESEMLKDWVLGKDFKIKAGPYCSIRDLDYLRDMSCAIWIYDMVAKIRIQVA